MAAALSQLAFTHLALSQLACSRDARGELYITLDSTDGVRAVEVLALPFDPAALSRPAVAPPARSARGDDLARYVALRDTARALDAEFQRERTSLNREALALRADTARRSRAYAERFNAWVRRAANAERTRALRDRVRSRLAALRARLGSDVPTDAYDPTTRLLTAATVDSAARAAGRTAVRAPVSAGSARIRLPAGRWWLTVGTARGAAADLAAPIDVQAGARDTVRLGGV